MRSPWSKTLFFLRMYGTIRPMRLLGISAATFRHVAIGAIVPTLALGAPTGTALREPATSEIATLRPLARVCSHDLPVCVEGRRADTIRQFLPAAEDAWTNLRIYGFSEPDRGLEPLRMVLDEQALEPKLTTQERVPFSKIDRAAATEVLVPAPNASTLGDACLRTTLAHQALLLASFSRTNPAMHAGIANGMSRTIAATLSGCALPDHVVTHPEESFLKREESSAAFFRWLDTHYGKEPLAVLHDLLALSATQTDANAFVWTAEPDVFDVMKESFVGLKYKGSKFEEVLVDYAVDRALHASHWVDWEIDWPKTPRRLLAARAVEPLGASLVKVKARGRALRIEASWEFESRFRWVAVKVDAQGVELGRAPIATPERATEVQHSLLNVEQCAEVWLVALNLGDPKRPMDPDELATEPHKWLLTLAEE
jgi:hypothetical protein